MQIDTDVDTNLVNVRMLHKTLELAFEKFKEEELERFLERAESQLNNFKLISPYLENGNKMAASILYIDRQIEKLLSWQTTFFRYAVCTTSVLCLFALFKYLSIRFP